MSEESVHSEVEELKNVAIEGKLPLKAVGIENLKEANPKHMPPHRYLHPWFARRPTPASRLAILASVLPESVDIDSLLRWMQIGPKRDPDVSINEYVKRKKETESQRNGTFEEHYGYPRPFTSTASKEQLEEIHKVLESFWDGELPTVLDPTAGGGVIPFESLRYGLPTQANELNPVPSVLLKVLLEYAPEVGSIERELLEWSGKIDDRASSHLEEYFPGARSDYTPEYYACTYTVICADCGHDIPLVPKWWLRKKSASSGVAVRPSFDEDGDLQYECVTLPDDVKKSEFNPQEGPVTRGDAECLNCGIVTEHETVKQNLQEGDFDYEIIGVKYRKDGGGSGYRGSTSLDQQALDKAARVVENDVELSTILSGEIPSGHKTDEPRNYGMEKWRDLFTPRQLIAHYEYLEAFDHYKKDIRNQYDERKAEAIITVLSLVSSKLVDRNSRLTPWDTSKGYPSQIFKGNNLAFRRVYIDNNLCISGMGYQAQMEKIIDSYEEAASYMPEDCKKADLTTTDAANLPQETGSVQAVVIDPPYYSSVMYAELSDVFYTWLREYLSEDFPTQFSSSLTNKDEEAVANPSKFESLADSKSKAELAKRDYENKMSDIFSELYRVLEPGGVMTVMFTHKETDAWDTLTMSLIRAGFTITSTHPITSEMPQRAEMRKSASADSTLLLTGRKPHQDRDNRQPTLWSEVKSATRKKAKESARDLLESGLSLTKTDIIIGAFGPTLREFADNFPVVDDEGEEVRPRRALREAREAVTQVLVETYLEGERLNELDDLTKWYTLSWLIYETDTFPYDEGRQLGLGVGVDIDAKKRDTKIWRKSTGDIQLQYHDDRVQDINKNPSQRSSRLPVDPESLSFSSEIDKVHAAMHVYEKKGESETWNWLKDRGLDSDTGFKSCLTALLQVLPQETTDWQLARDLSVGETGELLNLEIDSSVFKQNDDEKRQGNLNDF